MGTKKDKKRKIADRWFIELTFGTVHMFDSEKKMLEHLSDYGYHSVKRLGPCPKLDIEQMSTFLQNLVIDRIGCIGRDGMDYYGKAWERAENNLQQSIRQLLKLWTEDGDSDHSHDGYADFYGQEEE